MTIAQIVETSVTNNSSFQNYTHPDDHTTRTNLPFAGKPSNVMVDRTLPKVGLLYGVAQGYFTENKMEKKKKNFWCKREDENTHH